MKAPHAHARTHARTCTHKHAHTIPSPLLITSPLPSSLLITSPLLHANVSPRAPSRLLSNSAPCSAMPLAQQCPLLSNAPCFGLSTQLASSTSISTPHSSVRPSSIFHSWLSAPSPLLTPRSDLWQDTRRDLPEERGVPSPELQTDHEGRLRGVGSGHLEEEEVVEEVVEEEVVRWRRW